IIAVWFVVMRVIGRHIAERQGVEEALQHLASNANCLLWYATVEERDGGLVWTVLVTDDRAARSFLPIEVRDGQPFGDAWFQAKPLEDRVRMDETSAAALRQGKDSYEQEFRTILKDES